MKSDLPRIELVNIVKTRNYEFCNDHYNMYIINIIYISYISNIPSLAGIDTDLNFIIKTMKIQDK